MSKTDADIREEFLRYSRYERVPCRLEIAKFATNSAYIGFEDPRSAAMEALSKDVICDKNGCRATVKVDPLNDTITLNGECGIADVCAVEVRNNTERSARENKLIRKASSQQLSYICPHVTCEFSYGFTVDGGSGTAGECMNGVPLGVISTQ